MQASNEFVKGKHGIGWVSDSFNEYFKNTEFAERSMPTFQKLPRSMNDAAIESELKPGLCELGDIVAFMDNAPEECKDGWWNLFYTPAFVVIVHWHGDEWRVSAWRRGGRVWFDFYRVFSPATDRSESKPSSSLELRLSELEEWKKKVEKVINV